MLKRMLVVLTAILTMLAGVIAAPRAAQADLGPGACTWKLRNIPTRYHIGRSHPMVRIGGPCTDADNWVEVTGALRARGTNKVVPGTTLNFQGCSPDWVDPDTGWCKVLNDPDPPREYRPVSTAVLHLNRIGHFFTVPLRGYAIDDGDSQNHASKFKTQYFTAKPATTTTLSVTRHGARRTFTITARHYSISAKRFVKTREHPIYLQRRANGKWSIFCKLESDQWPIVYTVRVSKAHTWRAYTPSMAKRWASHSAATTK